MVIASPDLSGRSNLKLPTVLERDCFVGQLLAMTLTGKVYLHHQHQSRPPSTLRHWAVMYEASSEARNATAAIPMPLTCVPRIRA